MSKGIDSYIYLFCIINLLEYVCKWTFIGYNMPTKFMDLLMDFKTYINEYKTEKNC